MTLFTFAARREMQISWARSLNLVPVTVLVRRSRKVDLNERHCARCSCPVVRASPFYGNFDIKIVFELVGIRPSTRSLLSPTGPAIQCFGRTPDTEYRILLIHRVSLTFRTDLELLRQICDRVLGDT